jgi:2,3-bisphosphoglycerate-independent phosphoglycerate mutase
VLLLRGPGSVLTEAPFGVRHSPLVAACVAPTRIIAGLALSLGVTLIPAPGATGDYRTDLAAKAKAAAQALDCSTPHTFCLCHVKAVDDAGHDRNVAYRVAYLQAVDTMVGHLVKRLDAQQQQGKGARYVLCVTGDHSTPVLFGDHSHEPVPVALAHLADVIAAAGGPSALAALPLGSIATPEFGGPWSSAAEAEPPQPQAVPPSTAPAAGDSVLCFDELSAARGGLGRFCGGELMSLLKGFMKP